MQEIRQVRFLCVLPAYRRQALRLCEEKNPLILVRSASADRERLFMPFSTGYTRGYAQLDPLSRINPLRWIVLY
jgi:hypothetical protein